MRLIDAEEFEVLLYEANLDTEYGKGFDDGVVWMADRVYKAPTIHAVSCECCKHRSEFNVGDKYPCQLGGYVTLNDFCSKGELDDTVE